MDINKINPETCRIFDNNDQMFFAKKYFSSWISISDGVNTLVLKSGVANYQHESHNLNRWNCFFLFL